MDSVLDVPFEMIELKRALKRVKESATGQDGMSYSMIKHLSEKALGLVLDILNRIWIFLRARKRQ